MYVENIIVGEPIVEPSLLFALNEADWQCNEFEKTIRTNERFLPKILVDLGIASSISEIKRNRKDLCIELNYLDFIMIKLGKRKLWILVGK
jgi:hypothetical protein